MLDRDIFIKRDRNRDRDVWRQISSIVMVSITDRFQAL